MCFVRLCLDFFAQGRQVGYSIFPYTNTTCQSITQHFILYTIKIAYFQGDMFRFYEMHVATMRFIALGSVFPEGLNMSP